MLENFETKYKCAGFCKTPLFYVTKSVTERPTQECIKPMIKSVAGSAKIIGVVTAISFIVNLCGFCGSFALCTNFSKPEE